MTGKRVLVPLTAHGRLPVLLGALGGQSLHCAGILCPHRREELVGCAVYVCMCLCAFI